MGITRLSVEIDAALVKAALEEDEYRFMAMGGVITELKHMMIAEFSSCKITVCKRGCNKVVHALAAIGFVSVPVDIIPVGNGFLKMFEDLVNSDLVGSDE